MPEQMNFSREDRNLLELILEELEQLNENLEEMNDE